MSESLSIESQFKIYASKGELPASYGELISAANSASDNAYSPYSNFQVGAAVLTEDNHIHIGNNQENAAYPSGLCAERVALFHLAATNPDIRIQAIAVSAKRDEIHKPAMPCGACRQVMREYEEKQGSKIKVISHYKDGKFLISDSVGDLLPLSFTKNDL